MKNKFYKLDIGNATKYLTLTEKNNHSVSEKDFYNKIKNQNTILTEDRGKFPGDIAIGSWVTIFFSESFVNLLKKNQINSFDVYPIIFESRHDNKIRYFYLRSKLYIDFIVDGSYLSKDKREKIRKRIDSWIQKRNIIYFEGHDIRKTFYNLSKWNGEDLFGIKSDEALGNVILVTEKLKKIIEKSDLKNIQFEELKPYPLERKDYDN